MRNALLSLALVTLAFLAGCSGGSSNSGGPKLNSIVVMPANPTLTLASAPPASTLQFSAMGIYSDGTSRPLPQVTWSSSNMSAATINSSGLATSAAVGMTAISATSGSVSGSTALTIAAAAVTLQSITVTPANPTLHLAAAPPASTLQFTATGNYSDGSTQNLTSQVTWSSSNTAAATISSAGLATSVAVGMTTITATSGSSSGSTLLTITAPAVTLQSITVAPANASLVLGKTQAFTATGHYSDGSTQNLTTQVIWSSSMTSVATIASGGLATSVSVGSTTVTATLGSTSGSTMLTVTAAQLVSIAVTPGNASVPLGTLQQYTATGTYTDNSTKDLTASVTWSSSATGIATISSSGLLTARGLGSSTIQATSGSISGSTSVTINTANVVSVSLQPANATIANGTNLQYAAIATFNDGSTLNVTIVSGVSWTSSNTSVATIGPLNGLAVSKGVGSTMIGVSFGSFSDSSTLNVSSATIQSIAVSPVNPSIAPLTTERFVATGMFSDGSSQNITAVAHWQSSNTAVATVANAPGYFGLASALTQGSTSISAAFTSPGGPLATGSTTLQVTNAIPLSITVTPAGATISPSANVQYIAIATFTSGSPQNVTSAATWVSSLTSVATINSTGSATGVSPGSTNITASLGGVTSTAVPLTVTSSPLVSLAVSCTSPQIAQGTSEDCAAIGTFQDGTTQTLTSLVNWTSSQAGVATVSNTSASRGQVNALSAGSTTLTAYLNGIVGTTTLAVSNATLTSITVSPATPSIHLGGSQAFTAIGNFNDGTTQTLTTFLGWSSSSPAVAIISPAGLATSTGTGTTTISATLDGVTGTATLTVN
ncbi:MAG TPA: Ig-like domain-containing protein [Terriglobales bacterium]|nr:Ig-like domain-containing protein [Terriglobales bacterium]